MLDALRFYVPFFHGSPTHKDHGVSQNKETDIFQRSLTLNRESPSKLVGSILNAQLFKAAWNDLRKLNPNVVGSNRNTPLHLAALWGTKEQLKELVTKGALLDLKGSEGKTAYELAKDHGNGDLVHVLEKMGAQAFKNDTKRFHIVTVLQREEGEQIFVLDRKTNDLYPNYNPVAVSILQELNSKFSSITDVNPCLMLLVLPFYIFYLTTIMPILLALTVLEAFFLMMTRPAHVFAVFVVTPFYILGVMALNLAKIVTDVGLIALNLVVKTWKGGRGALFIQLSISVFYEVPKALLRRIYRAISAPFYGIWMMGASIQFLAEPNRALLEMNSIEKDWDEKGLLYLLRMQKIGNLGTSKIDNLAQFRLKYGL